jgi:hypothetical protein
MLKATRKMAKSFTIEREVDEYISETKGNHSASERVNEMLLRAIRAERYEKLEAEAQRFFATIGDAERKGTRAFQAAALRTMARD